MRLSSIFLGTFLVLVWLGTGCTQNVNPIDESQLPADTEEPAQLCGNTILDEGEACDAGEQTAYCDTDCTLAECGDGYHNPLAGEGCDDGAVSASCDADCTVAECGDRVTNSEAGEACDDGGPSQNCDADCTVAECGDGLINTAAGEICDDGGASDACAADCTPNDCGPTSTGEICDDGGASDACAADCTPNDCAPTSTGEIVSVSTFDQEFFNWASAHEETFDLPEASVDVERILMHMTIECPAGGCDPWDRLGHLKVLKDTGTVDAEGATVYEPFEIARFITPYAIDASFGGPGNCDWVFDVTDYQSLLRGSTKLSMYISTWIGGEQGWNVSVRFDYHLGRSARQAYEVINLWNFGHLVYGQPDNPVEDHLTPLDVAIDPAAESAMVRVITTGHGQGNTNNAAEFARKDHTIVVGDQTTTWELWRDDCSTNVCSPQGGNWRPNRAGWCPGASVVPKDIDVTSAITAGASVTVDYNMEPYENCCRPDNASCNAADGACCMSFAGECNYNYTGHTQPNYAVGSQLILYRDPCAVAE